MARTTKFNVEFKDNSKAVKKAMKQQQLKWLEMASIIIEGTAVSLCAVDTGRLRDSIDHVVDEGEMVAYVGTNAEYAIYVEFGTGEFAEKGNGRKGGWVYQDPSGEWFFTWGQEPQPFLRPAFKRNKQQIIKLLHDLMRELDSK